MKDAGAPQREPVPIGEAATPPFVKLPDPATLFASRSERFAVLARDHALGPYLRFLSCVCFAQHRVLDDLPEPDRLLPPQTPGSSGVPAPAGGVLR